MDNGRGVGLNTAGLAAVGDMRRCLKANAIALIGLVLPAAGHAYCPPDLDYSVRGELNRSDYVGIVRVVGVTWLDENRSPTKLGGNLMLGSMPGGFDPYEGANYRVIPERTFKGKASKRLIIFSENTEARTPLKMGSRYLVFLERQHVADEYRRVGDLMIDYCGNSSLLGKASTKLKELQQPIR